jgi:plasmid stabilization system protein ParE
VYKIHYLLLALNDLKEITQYIAFKLEAPQAAENFLSKLDKEVLKIADNPFRYHAYTPPEKLEYAYRVLYIDNYSLFYEVENNRIEIHRVIYSRRDTLRIPKAQETP